MSKGSNFCPETDSLAAYRQWPWDKRAESRGTSSKLHKSGVTGFPLQKLQFTCAFIETATCGGPKKGSGTPAHWRFREFQPRNSDPSKQNLGWFFIVDSTRLQSLTLEVARCLSQYGLRTPSPKCDQRTGTYSQPKKVFQGAKNRSFR